jgi:hypothetical protein
MSDTKTNEQDLVSKVLEWKSLADNPAPEEHDDKTARRGHGDPLSAFGSSI